MNKGEVLDIKDYVKCPQMGYKIYGKWRALTLEQKRLINKLCDSWLSQDAYIEYLTNEIIKLKKINKIEEIKMVGCCVEVPFFNNTLIEIDRPLAIETIVVKVNELIKEINKLEVNKNTQIELLERGGNNEDD